MIRTGFNPDNLKVPYPEYGFDVRMKEKVFVITGGQHNEIFDTKALHITTEDLTKARTALQSNDVENNMTDLNVEKYENDFEE